MLRLIRTLLLGFIGLLLVIVAVANLQLVTVHLLPPAIARLTGIDRTYELPLFLVILAAMLLGVALGLVWEWIRESGHRTAATQHRRTAVQLEREVNRLRTHAEGPKDDVLALLDRAEAKR